MKVEYKHEMHQAQCYQINTDRKETERFVCGCSIMVPSNTHDFLYNLNIHSFKFAHII
jgi:hypothetical protein